VTWIVGTAEDERRSEAECSAAALLAGAGAVEVRIGTFRDGHFPWQGSGLKDFLEDVARHVRPDLVFTHFRDDRHQDHRTLSDLTWTVFRDHLILEYEVLKYDGDLGAPNLYVPIGEEVARAKVEHLLQYFPSQRTRSWFRAETFEALMRVRAVESQAPSGFAEAFYARKVVL
jgi:LmbE family N-acetylglucosaminyl deacetylase